jgi:hypothetical protein
MTDLTPNDLSHLSDEEFMALCPQGHHAPGPEPLSPAAQAVRKAYYSTDDDLAGPALAAALRAAADQVVPYEASAPWNELKYDYDGDRWEMRQWVRDQLLAIAAELENNV